MINPFRIVPYGPDPNIQEKLKVGEDILNWTKIVMYLHI